MTDEETAREEKGHLLRKIALLEIAKLRIIAEQFKPEDERAALIQALIGRDDDHSVLHVTDLKKKYEGYSTDLLRHMWELPAKGHASVLSEA